MAQLLRDDPAVNLTLSTEPVDESIEASLVASRDQILPLEMVDFEHPDLAGLTCEELLARFIPDQEDATLEVGVYACSRQGVSMEGVGWRHSMWLCASMCAFSLTTDTTKPTVGTNGSDDCLCFAGVLIDAS